MFTASISFSLFQCIFWLARAPSAKEKRWDRTEKEKKKNSGDGKTFGPQPLRLFTQPSCSWSDGLAVCTKSSFRERKHWIALLLLEDRPRVVVAVHILQGQQFHLEVQECSEPNICRGICKLLAIRTPRPVQSFLHREISVQPSFRKELSCTTFAVLERRLSFASLIAYSPNRKRDGPTRHVVAQHSTYISYPHANSISGKTNMYNLCMCIA